MRISGLMCRSSVIEKVDGENLFKSFSIEQMYLISR